MKVRALFPLVGLLIALAPGSRASAGSNPLEGVGNLRGDALILHVLNRLGYGPRPGDMARVRKEGVYRYIVEQLYPDKIPDDACEKELAALPDFEKSATELAKEFGRQGPKERKAYAKELKRLADLRKDKDASRTEIEKLKAEIREFRKKNDRNRGLTELESARVIRAVTSNRQLKEVMVDFWMNHFNIYARKGPEALLIPEYEEKVIRPHALGKFEDLLVAVAKSPAMLYYLDNYRSVAAVGAEVLGPRGRLIVRHKKNHRGINENYGRELMELHTLGVNGGYTQQDVIQVARCLTGWSITSPTGRGRGGREEGISFVFHPYLHDAGPKVVLGKKIPAGRGIEDGMEVLHMLASSPATALHLSEELCRHFVSDHPPVRLVERCTGTWLDTGGDIRQVLYCIFTSPEFLSKKAAESKMKTPFEFAMSALRAVGADTTAPRRLLYAIGRLGEPLYMCEPPTGWPDTAAKWSGSNAILARVNFATALAFKRLPGVRFDLERLAGHGESHDPEEMAGDLARAILGRKLSSGSQAALDRALGALKKAGARRRPSSFGRREMSALAAVVLGSPDFQMR